MPADVTAIRAELNELTRRRNDAIASPPSITGTCPPHSAAMHRAAAFITRQDLPAADVTVTALGEVRVDATGCENTQNVVRQYAGALGLLVVEKDIDVAGLAAVEWNAAGYTDNGRWRVHGYELLPTPIVDRFGIGIGPAT